MTDSLNKPNAKYPHAYIILRIDDFQEGTAVEDKLSPVATYLDGGLAEVEAARLNSLRSDAESRYVVLISRLKG